MRFGQTGKIVAKADRSQDPFVYIDSLRQEVYELGEQLEGDVYKRLKILEDAERERLTKTGVWSLVKMKLDEEAVDWVKWGIRAIAAGLGASLLTAMGWLIAKAFHV